MSNSYKCKVRRKFKKAQKKDKDRPYKIVYRKIYRYDPDGQGSLIDHLKPEYYAAKLYIGSRAWDKLSEHEKLTVVNYRKNPSHWNREMNRKPKRAEDRDKLKCVSLDEEDDKIFTEDKKPNIYYW